MFHFPVLVYRETLLDTCSLFCSFFSGANKQMEDMESSCEFPFLSGPRASHVPGVAVFVGVYYVQGIFGSHTPAHFSTETPSARGDPLLQFLEDIDSKKNGIPGLVNPQMPSHFQFFPLSELDFKLSEHFAGIYTHKITQVWTFVRPIHWGSEVSKTGTAWSTPRCRVGH